MLNIFVIGENIFIAFIVSLQFLFYFCIDMYFSYGENDEFAQQYSIYFLIFHKDLRIILFALSTADVSSEAK